MIPRFRPGEVVRVQSLPPERANDQWLLGVEGTAQEVVGANEQGTRWEYSVWITEPGADEGTLDQFDEGDLASTGLVELDDGRRVPVDQTAPPVEMRDSIYLRAFTDITEEAEASRVADATREALQSGVGPTRKLEVTLERHWHEPFRYELFATVEPVGDVLAAFDRLASVCGSGWERIDEGWQCDLEWNQDVEADPGAVFLAPEITDAWVGVRPWNSPRRRPESERRG